MPEHRAQPGITCRRLVPSMETLGLVVSFLARELPFSEFRAGVLIETIKYQLSSGNHVCALEDERLVGYCGWMPITMAMGDAWMRDEGTLTPVPPAAADAVAGTVMSCLSPASLAPMLRTARMLTRGRRIYFKREGERRRKASVLNR